MECGFCGSSVNDGFNTCAECGAMHLPDQESLAFSAFMLKALGVVFCIAFSFFVMLAGNGAISFGGGLQLFLFGCVLPGYGLYHFGKQNKEAQRTFKWYRKP